MKTVHIEVLYPEFNNLYGDRGNLLYLTRKLSACEVELRITETHLYDVPAFAKEEETVDLLYIGPCTERQQELSLLELLPYADALEGRIDSNLITLSTGNAFELFGEYIERADGTRAPGLGIFPYHAKRFDKLRFNDRCVGRVGDLKITGFKNQLSHAYGENPFPFLEMQTGCGMNPESKQEGVRKNNFFATYLLGPLLPLNPSFSEKLVELLAGDGYKPLGLPWEQQAYDVRIHEL